MYIQIESTQVFFMIFTGCEFKQLTSAYYVQYIQIKCPLGQCTGFKLQPSGID
jgi:hypothetical protein